MPVKTKKNSSFTYEWKTNSFVDLIYVGEFFYFFFYFVKYYLDALLAFGLSQNVGENGPGANSIKCRGQIGKKYSRFDRDEKQTASKVTVKEQYEKSNVNVTRTRA